MSLGGVGDRDFTPPWRQPPVKKLDKYTDFNWRPTRGGKKAKKQQELAERVARGEYVPRNLAQAGNFLEFGEPIDSGVLVSTSLRAIPK